MRLHREHGLNPTIPTCFWCGKEKNELVLLGATYRGEAPKNMVLDHEPCDECKDNMSQGYMVFEVKQDRKTPTGKWCVLTHEAAERIGFPKTEHNKCAVEIGLIDMLLGNQEAA